MINARIAFCTFSPIYSQAARNCFVFQALRAANRESVKAFAVVLHAHLLGKELTLKHVRSIKQTRAMQHFSLQSVDWSLPQYFTATNAKFRFSPGIRSSCRISLRTTRTTSTSRRRTICRTRWNCERATLCKWSATTTHCLARTSLQWVKITWL